MSTLTLADVNRTIKALQAKSRPAAVRLLGSFGVLNTPQLSPESYRAVIELAEQETAKLDASRGS